MSLELQARAPTLDAAAVIFLIAKDPRFDFVDRPF